MKFNSILEHVLKIVSVLSIVTLGILSIFFSSFYQHINRATQVLGDPLISYIRIIQSRVEHCLISIERDNFTNFSNNLVSAIDNCDYIIGAIHTVYWWNLQPSVPTTGYLLGHEETEMAYLFFSSLKDYFEEVLNSDVYTYELNENFESISALLCECIDQNNITPITTLDNKIRDFSWFIGNQSGNKDSKF